MNVLHRFKEVGLVGDLSADVDAIMKYSVDAWAVSARIESALGAASAGSPLMLGPVFGVVGAQFLATFAQAHATHLDSISRLGTTAASLGAGAATAAASYDARDSATALELSMTREGLAP